MKKTLVIVESPAKAKTIGKFLGDDFVVESSIGHIRDLPRNAAAVPKEYKKLKWARLGMDVNNDFEPLYVVDPDKKQHISLLKKLLKGADELLLATDEDREGESIAWHLVEVLKPKVPVKRMVFHEITKSAIHAAIDNPRDINQDLVDAQEARRLLDRLVGYEVSPVLWKKVMRGLSAGRVQSVATRIVVERERERMRFTSASYWDVEAELATKTGASFEAKILNVDGKRLASGKDFDEDGKLKKSETLLLNEASTTKLVEGLKGQEFKVESLEQKPYKRSPSAPFMTSTLQQEANKKLRFSASRTMRAAQRLYEAGFITYMRTDSTTLSETALGAARALIKKQYGADYLPAEPRLYKKKVKNAQEAHEAIRPAGDVFQSPAEVAAQVQVDQAKVYELIWKRTVASQMADAKGQRLQVRILADTTRGEKVEFSTSGNAITFPGFLRANVEGSANPDADLSEKERHLPPLVVGEALTDKVLNPSGHTTQPPARFTEASLVRKLEELGVGRPSTYASTINTIQARDYVWRRGTALVPTLTALAVIGLLEKHFPHLVDYTFTAGMEDELDEIANGQESTVPWLTRFYFGANGRPPEGTKEKKPDPDAEPLAPEVIAAHIKALANGAGKEMGLKALVNRQLELIDARAINTLPIGNDEDGVPIAARVGKFGPYLQRGEDTVGVPKDLPPDELTLEKCLELLNAPKGDKELGTDPETSLPIYLKTGRFGAYVQLGEMLDGEEKPKTASLLKYMDSETLNLADAQLLLSLPRIVGAGEDGEEISATNGRYGPYIAHGKERRSLEKEEQIFAITLAEAKHLLAQPKQHRRRAAAPPLKELGEDPSSKTPIVLREGRFGLYVTDGETNASLQRGDDGGTITPERAQELLQLRREAPASKKKPRKAAKKKPAKKKAAKKKPAKKAAKKKPAKKATKKATKKKPAKKAAKKKPAKKD